MIKTHEIDDLYFNYQPIMRAESPSKFEIYSYEVLLRSRKNHRFPVQLFNDLIRTETGNQALLTKCQSILTKYLTENSNVTISLNIHPQQLLHLSTWNFLEAMSRFHQQMVIEITDLPPEFNSTFDIQELELSAAVEKIKEYGYRLALDDISCGQNTLSTVVENIGALSFLKFSLLPFRGIEKSTMLLFLKGWQQLAKSNRMLFVVEGVEDEEIAAVLCDYQINLQQGYYWGKGQQL